MLIRRSLTDLRGSHGVVIVAINVSRSRRRLSANLASGVAEARCEPRLETLAGAPSNEVGKLAYRPTVERLTREAAHETRVAERRP